MNTKFWPAGLAAALSVAALTVALTAWQSQTIKSTHSFTDTIPEAGKKIKSIDDALQQLEKSKQEIEKTLNKKDWEKEMQDALDKAHFDAANMKQQMEEAMKNIDAQKIQMQVQKAMKEADLQKMKADLQNNLNNINMKEVPDQIAKAMKEIDVQKIKSGMDASVAKIDMQKIKDEMERIKDIDLKGVEENLKKIKPGIEKSMQQARESIEKAKKELLEYKNFIDGLDKDGLINKNEKYIIEYENGGLTINGKKQPEEIIKKYSRFLKDRKDFTIKKDKDDFTINNN